jgi:hypothetical protein
MSQLKTHPTIPANQIDRRPSRAKRDRCGNGNEELGRYADGEGHAREVVALSGAMGSVLVVDRDASTLGDARLLAHLSSDEPAENARVVCDCYLRDGEGRFGRRVTAEDLQTVPFAEEQCLRARVGASPSEVGLTDRHGRGYCLQAIPGERCIRQLRWCEQVPDPDATSGTALEAVSVRDVIACMESYEPVRSLTAAAIACYRDEDEVSVARLRSELERVDSSPLVLNRGLREATLQIAERRGLSMSEIAMRCGRVKHDSRGCASGETSWLARRLGIMPCSGESEPTPWVHSDVLGLIAREGLRVSPREVELG